MAGMTTSNSELIIRQELWSNQLKEILRDELDAQRWVDWMTEFPDGEVFTVPSVGDAVTQDVSEDQAIQYDALDTGEWQVTVNEYVGSAHYITKKNLQDAFYAQQVLSSFVPKERRAIMEVLETDILKSVGPNASTHTGTSSTAQTVNSDNRINGYDHRYVGTGTNDIIAVEDFAYAKLALKKANVPLTNLVAIVDPNCAYVLETTSNIANVSNNPMWEGIITSGLTTGMRYVRNIYGFDVYESNYLDASGDTTFGAATVHHGTPVVANAVQNLLFSADPTVVPIKGVFRQLPEVDAEFNKDFQREEYVTTARWGVKLYRPENMVCILTDSTAIA